jgi:hypothetical protein
VREYATVTAEAASPLRGILCNILENTSQECATEKYFKDVLMAVSFQECAASLPSGSIFLPLSWLFISSARLEVKVLRFDGCAGYAQPIHTHPGIVNAAFSSRVGVGLCARSYTARYLFSGFLKCGLCGSNIVLISGRGGAGWAKYGCPLHQNHGMCAKWAGGSPGQDQARANLRTATGSAARRCRLVRPRGIQAPTARAPG